MPEWLSPVWLVDTVIALTVAEGLALWIFWRRTGRGVAPRDYACNLVSGLCLMLALRCALGAAAPWTVLAWLSAAGLAHATDIASRWRK
jgi:hypothetical protein